MTDFLPDLTLHTAIKLHLEHVLRLTRGNQKKAAAILGLTEARLSGLLTKHECRRDYRYLRAGEEAPEYAAD